jgi:Spy/CpxP family protein refolding chaperone
VAVLLWCCPARAGGGAALFRPTVKEGAMRTLIGVVALVVGMAAYAALPAAAVQRAGQKVGAGLAERIQDLHLTDAQEAKIAEIRNEYQPRVQEAAKHLAAIARQEVDKIRAVLTPEQQTKVAAMREERAEFRGERLVERLAHLKELDLTDDEVAKIMEIRQECHAKMGTAMQQLAGLLTGEQKNARLEALKAGMKRGEIIASLRLTGEQKEKVEAVGKEICTLVKDELAKMREVLSEAQKEKLQEFKEERREHVRDRQAYAIAHFKDLNLTSTEKEQIAAIRQEYRARVHEAGNALRARIREEVEAIVAVIRN